MELIIFGICCYLNYSRAKLAQLSGGKWALYSALSIFVALFIGAAFLMIFMTVQDPEFKRMFTDASTSGNTNEFNEYVMSKMTIINQLFILFCGVGGYLFVRYLLNKKIEVTNGNNNNISE